VYCGWYFTIRFTIPIKIFRLDQHVQCQLPFLNYWWKKPSYRPPITQLQTPVIIRRVWRYQRRNHNSYIEEEQTIQWPKEKVQKDKQRSTKHTYKTKDRVTWTPLKTEGELRCSHNSLANTSYHDVSHN
jgi:hypothetical protein